MRSVSVMVMLVSVAFTLLGCSGPTRRVTGQNELFEVAANGEVRRTLPAYSSAERREKPRTRESIDGTWGDTIEYNDDIVTLQVLSMYLDHLPVTLTGSRDVIVFAEVWESGEGGYDGPRLNSIVHIARNQMIPGRLSFESNVGYGPTTFKGHPLKVRFTAMILQKEQGQRLGSAADVIGNFSAAASVGTPYGAIASTLIGLVREILRNQPDVVAMDFEFTALSRSPEGLTQTISGPDGTRSTTARSVEDVFTSAASLLQKEPPESARELKNALVKLTDSQEGLNKAWKLALADVEAATVANLPEVVPGLGKIAKTDPKDGLKWELDGDRFIVCIDDVCVALDKVVDEERITALRKALQEFETSYAVVEALTAEAAPWSSSLYTDWPWLRYGMYAVIETAERGRFGGSANESGFRLGLEERVAFDRGWLRWLADGKLGDPIPTNYIVFSLTPGQLSETDQALLAASNADAQILGRLRQSETDLRVSALKMIDLAQSVNRKVAESRANELARKVAKSAMEIAPGNPTNRFESDFKSQFEQVLGTLSDNELGTGSAAWKATLEESLMVRWRGRFAALPLKGDKE